MPRPCCRRRIAGEPRCAVFQALDASGDPREEIVLALDELEAIRLVDLLGQYQEEAARSMQVSRQTLGRVLERARRKVAEALVGGKTLRIEGGSVEVRPGALRRCRRCHREQAQSTVADAGCPECGRSRPGENDS